MALQTREPTGAVPWPLILVEGGEKTGKSWSAAVLSSSPKVGRTVVLDLSEGSWDEYRNVPGARFRIAIHDGSWASVYGVVTDAKAEAQKDAAAGKPPFVLVVDSMTAIWDLLKDWASTRARTSRANRAKLERDPAAEIQVPMNLWNDANARHRRLMSTLMTFPGIVIVTARGGLVAAVENGQPAEGKKSYRVEGNKNLGFDSTAWVRLSREDRPVLVGARSVHAGVRPGIDPVKVLPDDWTLEWLVFGALKCDPASAHIRDLVEPRQDTVTPELAREEALDPATPVGRLQELYRECKRSGYDDVTVLDENGQEEALLTLLGRIGKKRKEALFALNPDDPWLPAIRDVATVADAEKMRAELEGTFRGKPEAASRLAALRQVLTEREREITAAPAAVAA